MLGGMSSGSKKLLDQRDQGPVVAVAYDRADDRLQAEALAAELSLPIAKGFRDPHELHLVIDAHGRLCLRVNPEAGNNPATPDEIRALSGGHDVCVDLLSIDTTSSAGRAINTPFFRALGVRKGEPRRPRVLDATAGLGEDAWLLASAGCQVVCLERNPIVHALLRDGLRRALAEPPLQASQRQQGTIGLRHDSILQQGGCWTKGPAEAFDVVYLDPMFPTGRRAVERKPMRVLRHLVGDDDDAQALWQAAMQIPARRVVVKRPRKAPLLGDVPPTLSQQGKALRYDIYIKSH